MRKIPTLFARDFEHDPRYVTRDVTPGCEWVLKGEGVPTRKYDGTCVMWDGGHWWARREVKPGKTPPIGYIQVEHDEETGKSVGWEPLEQSAFAKWHAEAIRESDDQDWPHPWPHGTYELLGPKINGNPEGYETHVLLLHDAADEVTSAPREFDGLAAWLHAHPYEGIVWHHPDGRMAKLKKRDFRPDAGSTRQQRDRPRRGLPVRPGRSCRHADVHERADALPGVP